MKILHLVENFSQPTETFIKRYVEKSLQFATAGVVTFNVVSIPAELENKIEVFEITNRFYTRKTLPGLYRAIKENVTGKKYWHNQLNDILTSFKPDIVHCHFGTMGVVWSEFESAFNTKIPFVTSFYGYDASSLPATDKIYRKKLNALWQAGTAFFAEGPALLEKLVLLGCPPPQKRINPLLITTNSSPVKTQYRQHGDPLKFLFVGRFVEKKGFDQFLLAIASLKNTLPPFTIDIIGAGPCKEVYDEIISRENLQINVNWLGMKPHNDILQSLANYDFLVHPSLTASDNDSEGGAPTIIIEAQAAGLPVIASDHADIPFVMGYHDFMAKEADIDSLKEIICKIIACNNIEHYAGLGIKKVYGLHDIANNTTYQENLYSSLN